MFNDTQILSSHDLIRIGHRKKYFTKLRHFPLSWSRIDIISVLILETKIIRLRHFGTLSVYFKTRSASELQYNLLSAQRYIILMLDQHYNLLNKSFEIYRFGFVL